MASNHVNAVVVGAGAGGGIVAKELATAGLSVVLFERGRWQSFDDHDHDELISQRVTVLGNAFGPDDDGNPRRVRFGDTWRTVLPSEGAYGNNAACVGGGTLSYGAMAWRFAEQDFRMRSIYGSPAGSTLDDWPVTYDDLEPFYEKAEYEIGVAGEASNPFAAPRRKPYPMPPFRYNTEGRLLEGSARRLGFHPFPIPMLRNSVPYGGRAACIGCRYCVGFACEVQAKCGTHNTVIPIAMATGNCAVRTQAMVNQVLTDGKGRATGVSYYDKNGRLATQSADLVVVSGAATETARLLLNSRSTLFPTGLGNRHDWVGRNLQGHAYCGAWGLFEDEVYDDVGAGATIAICDFNHGTPGLRGGGMLANEFIRLPYLFSRNRPDGAPRWGREHKDFQRKYFKRSISVIGPVQEMPVFDCRVELDPDLKDRWGIPVARISGARHPHDLEIAQFMASKADAWLKETGATRTFLRLPGSGVSGGQHQAGTCRMGNDPKTSVVNRHCQVHDVDNLFVVDGSVHVTNGGYNPVLTIMAIAYWASDYITREWKGTGFRS
jgi:choline dehydrogenase-like flavoprotein